MIKECTDKYWALRPSISLIPIDDDVVEFFQSSTRRQLRFRLSSEIRNLISNLDGKRNIQEICSQFNTSEKQTLDFLEVMHNKCIIEPISIREEINNHEFSRILNFLGDYFPASELFQSFEKIEQSKVAIFGCGAVGSWTSVQLAHSGFKNFILIDDDKVEESNLNRSLYTHKNIGFTKIESLVSILKNISTQINVECMHKKVSNSETLDEIIVKSCPSILVNCADEPSVDMTSELVNVCCQNHKIPYVIAGGYNLHLSLIGLTVIPKESACFKCSKITLNEFEDKSNVIVRRLARPERKLGSLAPLAGITSALTASEVLRVVLHSKRLKPAMLNRRGEFNFLTNKLNFIDLLPRMECGCVTP